MPTFTIKNLSTNAQYIYDDGTVSAQAFLGRRIDCLISSSMIENGESSGVNNPARRDHYRSQIRLGQRTASIGDLCVIIR